MRKLASRLSAFAVALLLSAALASGVFAQVATQASPTRLDAANFAAVGTNANTVNTQSVATATPPSNMSVYVTAIYMAACQDATGTAAVNVNWTTSGLGTGASASPQFPYSSALAIGSCANAPGLITFPNPLKSTTPGVAVVLTSPAAIVHTGFESEIFGYYAQ